MRGRADAADGPGPVGRAGHGGDRDEACGPGGPVEVPGGDGDACPAPTVIASIPRAKSNAKVTGKYRFIPNQDLHILLQKSGVMGLLHRFGHSRPELPFIADPSWALPSVIATNVWKGIPFCTLIILSGLKPIDHEFCDAAVDGANAFQRFVNITLPGLRFVLIVACLLSLIFTLNAFGLVYIMLLVRCRRAWVTNGPWPYLPLGIAAIAGVALLCAAIYLHIYQQGGSFEARIVALLASSFVVVCRLLRTPLMLPLP